MADAPKPFSIMRLAEAAAIELDLPPNFAFDLLKEDDWSFVVKAHALLESVVTQALLEHVTETRLHDDLSKLDLGRKRRMLESVMPEMFDSRNRRFMQALSELRNRLVHNVRRVRFTFAEGLASDKARREFEADFAPFGFQPDMFDKGFELTPFYPKLIVWLSLTTVTAKVQGYKAVRRAPSVRGLKQALIDALNSGSTDGVPPDPAE